MKHTAIERCIDARCCGNHRLHSAHSLAGSNHHRQIVGNLLASRTRHHCHYRQFSAFRIGSGFCGKSYRGAEISLGSKVLAGLSNLHHCGISRIFHVILVPLLEEARLKWQNRIKFGDVALNLLHTVLLPCPHLRRDEIECLYALAIGIFCHFKVERRIIHQHHSIGLPLIDALAGSAHKAQNLAQVSSHFHKTHISHVAVVYHRCTSCSLSHQVATEEAKLSLCITPAQSRNQPGCMNIARSLSCNHKILHIVRNAFLYR